MPLDYTSITTSDQLNIDSNLDFQSHKGINVTDPSSAQDIATKNYTDTNFLNYSKFIFNEVPSGTKPGTVFTLANTPHLGTQAVHKNGLLLTPGVGSDYTISGATITFATTIKAGDKLLVHYLI